MYNNALFYSRLFDAFCFNAPYLFTPLLDLRLYVFGSGPWLCIRIYVKFFLWEYYILVATFLFTPTFSGTQLGRKTRPWCIAMIYYILFIGPASS